MEQVLFVLQDGKISQWNLSRGKLKAATIDGLRQVPYSAATAKKYWDDWKEDNQVLDADVYDSIFLSDRSNDFGVLPKWICADSKDKSTWTFEQLSLLANDKAFKATGFCLVQGGVKRLIGTDDANTAIKLYLTSSLDFALPSEPVVKPQSKPKKESEMSSLLERAKALQAEQRLIGSHPIMKMGLGRYVQDAYFNGLVFAAIADDNKVDTEELVKLTRVAKTLNIDESEVGMSIATIEKMDDNNKIDLGKEIAMTLGDTDCALLFLCEFSLLWMSHTSCDRESLCGWRQILSEYGLAEKFPENWFKRFDKIADMVAEKPEALLELEDNLSEEMIIYLFADRVEYVSSIFKTLKAKKRQKEQLILALKDVADKYGTRDTIDKGIFADVFNSVKGIAPENIDFNEHSRKLLNEVDQLRIRQKTNLLFGGYLQTMDEEDKAKAKIIVWKLLVLIAVKFEYPLGGTQLRKAKQLLNKLCRDPSQGGLKEMFHNYVSKYLAKTTECT